MFCARFLCSCLRGVCCPCFLPPIDHSELGQKLNYFLGICGSKQTLPFVDTGTSISDVSQVYSTVITVVYCMYVHVRTTCMYTHVLAKLNDIYAPPPNIHTTLLPSLAAAYDVVLVCRCIPSFLHPNLFNAFSVM